MSWVGLERAVKIALERGLPADLPKWQSSRDQIYHQIMAKGWHAERQAFVQHYDTEFLDAAVLLMPLVNFVAPTDRRWLSTLDAMSSELVSDSLVYRYNVEASPDGLEGEEGTFSICTFWYVEALARAGRLDEARLAFEKMLTYANHLGLYSEEIGLTGEALGNFPQAFTHLALISAGVLPRPRARLGRRRRSELRCSHPAVEDRAAGRGGGRRYRRACALDELRIPSGPDAPEPDDAWWFWEQARRVRRLIVSTPIISRTVAGRLKLLADRLLGPNADAAIIDELVAVRRAGGEPVVPFRVDERVLKPRVAGFIAVGGSLTPQWKTLTLPDPPHHDVLDAHRGRRPGAVRGRRHAALDRAR